MKTTGEDRSFLIPNSSNGTGKIDTPGKGKGWVKLKGKQGWRDKNGNIWKKDMKHKDHWDASDIKGRKIKEVDFDGREIWPNGPKNRSQRP